MEVLELFADLYIAVGSAIDSIRNRLRNFDKIISIASIGSDVSYSYLTSLDELKSTISSNNKVKVLLIDMVENKNKLAYIHCILLDARMKYINSLTVKDELNCVPEEIFNVPQIWKLDKID